MKSLLSLSATVLALSALGGELTIAPGGLSPAAALAKIRAEKAKGNAEAWTVRVKPGHYALTETLVFTPADSGTPAGSPPTSSSSG